MLPQIGSGFKSAVGYVVGICLYSCMGCFGIVICMYVCVMVRGTVSIVVMMWR